MIMRHFWAAALAAAIALSGSVAVAAQPPLKPYDTGVQFAQLHSDIAADPDARFGHLPNGLTYVIRHNDTPDHSAFMLMRIDSGFVQERDDERGYGNLVMRLAFEGTEGTGVGTLMSWLQPRGMRMTIGQGTFVDVGSTRYQLALPQTDATSLKDGLFVLRQIASGIRFDPVTVNAQRAIAANQSRFNSNAAMQAMTRLRPFLFAGQPAGVRDPFGQADVVEAATPMTLRGFYSNRYRPETTSLLIAGDFDVDAMEAAIKAAFADWQGTPAPAPLPALPPYKTRGENAHIITAPGVPTRLLFSWGKPFENDYQTFASYSARMRQSLAMSAFNSRLMQAAAEPGSHFVQAGGGRNSIAGTLESLSLNVIPKPGEEEAAFIQVMTMAHQMADYGISQGELNAAVSQADSWMKSQAGTSIPSDAIVQTFARELDFKGVINSPQQEYEHLQIFKSGLTLDAVNAAARDILHWDGPTVGLMGEGFGTLTEAQLDKDYATVMAAPAQKPVEAAAVAWPYTDFGPAAKLVSSEKIAALDTLHLTYANGLQVFIKHRSDVKENIQVRVSIDGGLRKFPRSGSPSPFLTQIPEFVSAGMAKINRADMNQALNGHYYTLVFGIGDDSTFLMGDTNGTDLDTQLQVLMAYATDYKLDPATFAAAKSALPAHFNSMATDRGRAEMVQSRRLTHAGDARFAPMSQEDAANLTLEQAQAAFDLAFSPAPTTLTIVGDIDPARAQAAVEKTFAALKPLPKAAVIPQGSDKTAFPATDLDKTLYFRAGDDVGMTYIAWPTTDGFSDPQLNAGLKVMIRILNQRFYERYHASWGLSGDDMFSAITSNAFKGFGEIHFAAALRGQQDGATLQAADSVTTSLMAAPPSADELAQAKAWLLTNEEKELTGNHAWARDLSNLSHPWGEDEILHRRDRIQAVTAQQVQDLANTYLRADKRLHMKLLPLDLREKSAS